MTSTPGQAQEGVPSGNLQSSRPCGEERDAGLGSLEPPPRPRAPRRLPGGARVPRRAPPAGSAAPSRQLGQHFALTLAPAPDKLHGSAGAGAGGGGRASRDGGARAPSPTTEREGGWRGGRKAAGRPGSEPAATPTLQDARRRVAPGPRAARAARRMAPRRREPRAAPRSPAQSGVRPPRRRCRPREPPAGRDYISSGARLDLAGSR